MKLIDWRICSECTDMCEYCFASKKISTVNYNNERAILQKISDSDIEAVNITGGEPLINPKRCLHIMDTIKRSNKKLYLSTNGYNAIDYIYDIKDLVSLLGLPLDGWNKESNMLCGRSDNAFERVQKILNHPVSEKINIKIGTVITRKNYSGENLKNISSFLDEYSIKIWRIYEVLPENRGMVNHEKLQLSEDEWNSVLNSVKHILRKSHRYKIEVVTRKNRNLNYMIIQPDGEVMVPLDIGNQIYEKPIGNLVNSDMNELLQKWANVVKKSNDCNYLNKRMQDICGLL